MTTYSNLTWAMTKTFYEQKLKDKTGFCCPNGCSRIFTGKTEEQKLKDQLDRERVLKESIRDRLSVSERSNSALRGVNTRKKNQLKKVKNGVCPCCDRFFENLHRHMKTQHTEFQPEKP